LSVLVKDYQESFQLRAIVNVFVDLTEFFGCFCACELVIRIF